MRPSSLALLAIGIAVGYAAAHQLLAEDGIPEQVPPDARARLEGQRTRLIRARDRAKAALVEARAERKSATDALMKQYHELTDRDA